MASPLSHKSHNNKSAAVGGVICFHESEDININKDFEKRSAWVKSLFDSAFRMYQKKGCPCAYPRFRQLASIDCSGTGHSFTCLDTELFIDAARKYFVIGSSDQTDEITNELWTCKTCKSQYEYGWSDFSIHVSRQKLSPVKIYATDIGLPTLKPVPLYLGLFGHSYPPKTELKPVSYWQFKNYVMEKISLWPFK
jgi:hypothetical protein